jgi:hypothetical protein
MENQLLILLVCKESFLNLKEINQPLPSLAISSLQEFEDVILHEISSGLLPFEALNMKLILLPGAVIQNRPA